jgi:hypothetical protein
MHYAYNIENQKIKEERKITFCALNISHGNFYTPHMKMV